MIASQTSMGWVGMEREEGAEGGKGRDGMRQIMHDMHYKNLNKLSSKTFIKTRNSTW